MTPSVQVIYTEFLISFALYVSLSAGRDCRICIIDDLERERGVVFSLYQS